MVKHDDKDKLSSYESGFEPLGNARMKISIFYWIIGLLYLIFDLEIIFFFPFAAILSSLNSLLAFWSLMFFIIILTIGFIYEYSQGALSLH